jgi:hypothetical protein
LKENLRYACSGISNPEKETGAVLILPAKITFELPVNLTSMEAHVPLATPRAYSMETVLPVLIEEPGGVPDTQRSELNRFKLAEILIMGSKRACLPESVSDE